MLGLLCGFGVVAIGLASFVFALRRFAELEEEERRLAGELGCVVEVLDDLGAPTVDHADPPDGHKLAPAERVKALGLELKAAREERDTWRAVAKGKQTATWLDGLLGKGGLS